MTFSLNQWKCFNSFKFSERGDGPNIYEVIGHGDDLHVLDL